MKYAHTITITVFAKHEDDPAKLEEAVRGLVGFNLEDEKIPMKKTGAEGFEHKITIIEIVLSKERHTSRFIEQLKEHLGPDQSALVSAQENRVDEECALYIRLDKKSLLEKRYVLTDAGDCFHIKMALAAFPKKRSVAIKVCKQMLEQNPTV